MTSSFYLVGFLFLVLLAVGGAYEIAWRVRVLRAKPIGTLGGTGDPFQEPPGYRVQQAIPGVTSFVEERFTVSVAASASLNFKATIRIPAGVRLTVLQSLSPSRSNQILSRYFDFEKMPQQPWSRTTAEEVAATLSLLSTYYGSGTLEARGGRLVYSWSRVQDSQQVVSCMLAELAMSEMSKLVTLLEAENCLAQT